MPSRGAAHGVALDRELELGDLGACRGERRGRLPDDLGARAVDQLREPVARRALIRDRGVLQRALPVEFARGQQLLADELFDAFEFLRLGRGPG